MTWGNQNTEAEAFEQMDIACQEFGVNFLDTAEIYPVPPNKDTQGLTEQYIGNWMDKKKNRKDVTIATSIPGPLRRLPHHRLPGASLAVNNKKNIEEALDGSLKRLKTDYLDLYQIHWPDRYVPLFGADGYEPEKEREAVTFMEQLEAMGDLIKKGKIRHWGLSNETPWGVSQFSGRPGKGGLPRQRRAELVLAPGARGLRAERHAGDLRPTE
ncbi:unnamed protein product [Heterosigma akashiwo]